MGASAAYRQVASVGGSAAQHSRKSKQGGAACESKRKKVREAEAVALHGGHPGGSASGKSPSTKGFPHGPVLRGRQSKDILFWYGSSSGGRLQRPCAACVRAGCVPGACVVRAGCVPCGQGGHRQKPGDGCATSHQEISIVRQKRIPQSARPGAGCASTGVRAVCGAVRPLSRQGISTACPLGTDLGMKVDLPRPPIAAVQGGAGRCMGGAWAVHGRCRAGALGGDDFSKRAAVRAARACAGDGAVPRPLARLQRQKMGGHRGIGEQAQRCGAAPGEREGARGRVGGSEISCGVGPLILA